MKRPCLSTKRSWVRILSCTLLYSLLFFFTCEHCNLNISSFGSSNLTRKHHTCLFLRRLRYFSHLCAQNGRAQAYTHSQTHTWTHPRMHSQTHAHTPLSCHFLLFCPPPLPFSHTNPSTNSQPYQSFQQSLNLSYQACLSEATSCH